jgi:hypothetical protein
MDPNASVLANETIQLSAIASKDAQTATAGQVQMAQIYTAGHTADLSNVLTAWVAKSQMSTQLEQAQIASSASLYHDNIASVTAANNTNAHIELAKIAAGEAAYASDNSVKIASLNANTALVLGQAQAQAQTTIAGYNASAASAAAASQTQSKDLSSVLGFGGTVLGLGAKYGGWFSAGGAAGAAGAVSTAANPWADLIAI